MLLRGGEYVGTGGNERAEFDECAHNVDADFHGTIAIEDTCRHDGAVFGEGAR